MGHDSTTHQSKGHESSGREKSYLHYVSLYVSWINPNMYYTPLPRIVMLTCLYLISLYFCWQEGCGPLNKLINFNAAGQCPRGGGHVLSPPRTGRKCPRRTQAPPHFEGREAHVGDQRWEAGGAERHWS